MNTETAFSRYNANPNKCKVCAAPILAVRGQLSRAKSKIYCSQSCAAKVNNLGVARRRITRACLDCGKEVPRAPGKRSVAKLCPLCRGVRNASRVRTLNQQYPVLPAADPFATGGKFEIIATCRGGGYMYARTAPSHPNANKKNLYPLHRVLMENKIGRLLKPNEHVHHMDEDKTNNQIENLELLTASEHARRHREAKQ